MFDDVSEEGEVRFLRGGYGTRIRGRGFLVFRRIFRGSVSDSYVAGYNEMYMMQTPARTKLQSLSPSIEKKLMKQLVINYKQNYLNDILKIQGELLNRRKEGERRE